MTAPSKGENNMSVNNDKPAQTSMPSASPPPLSGRPSAAPVATPPKEDLIPYWLLIGIFAVVMALTAFLLSDNWVTDMTRYRSQKAQQRGDWTAAIQHLDKMMQSSPQAALSPTYLSETGYSYFHLERYDKALEFFQKAQAQRANIPPDEQGNPRPPYNFSAMIGLTQFKMKDIVAAKQSLQAALQHNKLDPSANFTLGEIAMQEGNYTQAANYFKVVASHPGYEEPVKNYYAEIEKKLFSGIT